MATWQGDAVQALASFPASLFSRSVAESQPVLGVVPPRSLRSTRRVMKRAMRKQVRLATGNPRMGWKAAKKWLKRHGRPE